MSAPAAVLGCALSRAIAACSVPTARNLAHQCNLSRPLASKSLELRAATSFAKLRQQREGDDEARNLLASTYRWFEEGTGTADLRRARDVLTALR